MILPDLNRLMIHVNLPAMNIADQPCRYWKWNNMKTMVILVKTPTHFYSFQPVWHSKSLTLLQVPLTPSAPQLNPWETMDDLASSLASNCWWTKSQTTTWDGQNPVNNGIFIILGGVGFCPSTVWSHGSRIYFKLSQRRCEDSNHEPHLFSQPIR